MAITDQTVLSQIQRVTVENAGDLGATWPSGMWTKTEVVGYLNQRQNRFLTATGLMWKRDLRAVTTGQNNQPNPADWIATVLVAYETSGGVFKELPRMSAQEFDLKTKGWPGTTTAAMPAGFYEIDGATLTTYLVPAPTDVGSQIERYYVAMGTVMDQSGIPFSVPDEFVPTVKYGALADMFSKVGQANNPELAAACEERWQEGVELGKLMAQEGWFAL